MPSLFPTQAEITRAIDGVRKRGLEPAGIEILPDGTLRLLFGNHLAQRAGTGKDAEAQPEPW